MDRIARQSRVRKVTFTEEERVNSGAALTLATMAPGDVGYEEARDAYVRAGQARLERARERLARG